MVHACVFVWRTCGTNSEFFWGQADFTICMAMRAKKRLGSMGAAAVWDQAPREPPVLGSVVWAVGSLVLTAPGGVLACRACAGHLFLTIRHPCLFLPPLTKQSSPKQGRYSHF